MVTLAGLSRPESHHHSTAAPQRTPTWSSQPACHRLAPPPPGWRSHWPRASGTALERRRLRQTGRAPARGHSHVASSPKTGTCAWASRGQGRHYSAPGQCNQRKTLVRDRRRPLHPMQGSAHLSTRGASTLGFLGFGSSAAAIFALPPPQDSACAPPLRLSGPAPSRVPASVFTNALPCPTPSRSCLSHPHSLALLLKSTHWPIHSPFLTPPLNIGIPPPPQGLL